MAENEFLVSLNLGNPKMKNKNKISEAGAQKLGNLLASNQVLVNLDLSCLGITEGILKRLCDGLASNRSLRSLNLSKNGIGSWGGALLSEACVHTNLERLDLSLNYLSDQGIRDFARYLDSKSKAPTLLSLDIGSNMFGGIGFGNLADKLSRNFTLQQLRLDGNSLGGKRLITLKNFLPCSAIQRLSLRNCELDDESIEMIKHGIKKNKSLSSLDLSKNFIYAKGVRVLVDGLFGHPTLSSLNLGSNRVGDQCVDSLIQLLNNDHKLQFLDLSNNLLSEVTANKLLQVLRENKQLRSLNLKNNSFNFQQALKMEEMITKRAKTHAKEHSEFVLQEIQRLSELTAKRDQFLQELEKRKQDLQAAEAAFENYAQVVNLSKEADKVELDALEAQLATLCNASKDVMNEIYELEERKSE